MSHGKGNHHHLRTMPAGCEFDLVTAAVNVIIEAFNDALISKYMVWTLI